MEKELLNSYHTVVSYELDSFGHVNNATFLNYLEKARGDYMTLKGLSFKDFAKWKKIPVVTKATLVFKYPAYADDKLLIRGWISEYSTATFSLRYEIFNRDNNKLLLTGETRHVFVNEKNRPTRIPGEFYDKFIAQLM
ncbi:MAG: acyl-CoA thioesterase [Candidatus Aminicenantes bacterium]|jgi:acyl-CoA thioester hydrolase|nr:acyl-CoA thioesterase [Candidatus Aminicenantes bacterium]